LLAVFFVAGCGIRTPKQGPVATSRQASVVDLGLSSTDLDLTVSANACYGNGAQNYFRVKNADTAAVALSDITIKYWINDTTGNAVVPQIWYGGCVTDAGGTCVHQVSNVTASAASFPACGPDANHQANWEITITTADSTVLDPGFTWSGVQSAVNLSGYQPFTPGSGTWYSGCGSGQPFKEDPHFAVYAQGKLVTSNGITPPDCRAPHGSQRLTGYISPLFATAPLVGPVPASTPVTMAVSLPVRVPADFPTLADFVRQVSDPSNARYRQFLTPADYANHYRPSQDSYDALTAFAQQGGLTILNSYDDNELVDIKGTAGQFNRLLFTNLNYYLRPDGSQFFALDREPSLELSVPILRVGGTDNFIVHEHGAIPSASDGLIGNDFRNAYVSGCASGLDGSGQSIALIEEEGFNVSDVQAYDAAAGIPDPTIITVTFTANFPASLFAPDISATGTLEAPLDVEVAHAMAPGATIVVYQSPEASAFGVNFEEDMLHAVAHPSGIVPRSLQVSSSWFMSGDSDSQQSINAMSSMGQSFFECSGDGGAYTGTSLDIRTFDNVTVVGGTSLVSAAAGAAPVETAWAQTGAASGGGFFGPSGFSILGDLGTVGIPSYQTAFVNASNQASATFRNVPDVSMVAMNIVGVTTASDGTKGVRGGGFWGTSFATPMFAGFMAMANQKSQANGVGPVGFANPVLYAIADPSGTLYATTFNDVQSGSNPVNVNDHGFVFSAPDAAPPTGGFAAVAGYDLATGLGSPTCGLLTQLASPTPTVPVGAPPTLTASPSFAGLTGGQSCGIVQGALECWGDGHNTPVCSPLASAGTAVSGVTVGAAVCVIEQADSSVSCFGDNRLGELGPQAVGQTSSATPVRITGFPAGTSVVQISGGDTICAVLSDGSVWCWGGNNSGQLGNGTVGSSTDANPTPTQVQGLPAAAQVSVGGGSVCAVLQSGNVSCWGSNLEGILGVHSLTPTPTPQTIKRLGSPLANVTSISVGGDHVCALTTHVLNQPASGVTLYCWGDDHFNQLGVGDIFNGALDNFELFPRAAGEITGCKDESSLPGGGGCPTPLPVVSVTCDGSYTCVLLTDGTVRCVGDNRDGQLGNGMTSVVPEATPQTALGLTDITAISSGGGHTCAQHATGAISCWGASVVGNGSTGNVSTPAALSFARCL
jgi:alpha-tubulin suppressor-like RCC1 family protein